jgi:hypothetical protein
MLAALDRQADVKFAEKFLVLGRIGFSTDRL